MIKCSLVKCMKRPSTGKPWLQLHMNISNPSNIDLADFDRVSNVRSAISAAAAIMFNPYISQKKLFQWIKAYENTQKLAEQMAKLKRNNRMYVLVIARPCQSANSCKIYPFWNALYSRLKLQVKASYMAWVYQHQSWIGHRIERKAWEDRGWVWIYWEI